MLFLSNTYQQPIQVVFIIALLFVVFTETKTWYLRLKTTCLLYVNYQFQLLLRFHKFALWRRKNSRPFRFDDLIMILPNIRYIKCILFSTTLAKGTSNRIEKYLPFYFCIRFIIDLQRVLHLFTFKGRRRSDK